MDEQAKYALRGITKMPVFIVVSIVLIVIYIGYANGNFKRLPCGPGVVQAFERNLVHVDLSHIAANLGSFFILSSMEVRKGSAHYAIMIATLLVLCTGVELALNKGQTPKQCSIGFSGVLFGLLAWQLVDNQGQFFELKTLAALGLAVYGTSASNPRASFQGHLIGAGSGLVAGLMARLITGKNSAKKLSYTE